jgi:hypothetical protein
VPKSRSRRKPTSRPRARTKPVGPPLVPQPAPGVRGEVERRSAPALVWLSSRPRFLVPLLSIVLLVAGLAAPPGLGVPVLLVLVAFLGWLSYLSWPALAGVQRWIRLGTVGLVLAAVAGRLTG